LIVVRVVLIKSQLAAIVQSQLAAVAIVGGNS